MAQSTLLASSNYLLSFSDTQYELRRMHVHPSKRSPRSFEVDVPWNCINLSCNIAGPHVFRNPSTIPPPPPDVPVVLIGRFNPADTPFPKRNIWGVLPDPTLCLANGHEVFLLEFGVVTLRQAQTDITSHLIFNACDATGLCVAQIAYVEERVPPAATSIWKKGLVSLYNLFR